MKFPKNSLPLVILVASLAGCNQKEEIRVYRVEKESDEEAPATMPADPHAGVPMPAGAAADLPPGHPPVQPPNTVTGQHPDNWKAGKVSSMRQASFLAEGANGETVDISLIILPGAAGGALENVNRWRGQVGQEPVDAPGLAQTSTRLNTALGEALVVDLAGLPEGADPLTNGRMVAAIIERPKEVWFFKMWGNVELAGEQKDGFLLWVSSAGAAPTEATPTEPAPTAPAARKPDLPNWTTPAHWVEAPLKPMRLVTYTVTGSADGTAEVTVVKLSGDGGGSLPNINRWRGQIGLAPIQADDLDSLIEAVPGTAPPISQANLPGPENSTVVAWTLLDGSTWYFKLSGASAVVEAETKAFDAFLKSIEFPTR